MENVSILCESSHVYFFSFLSLFFPFFLDCRSIFMEFIVLLIVELCTNDWNKVLRLLFHFYIDRLFDVILLNYNQTEI